MNEIKGLGEKYYICLYVFYKICFKQGVMCGFY